VRRGVSERWSSTRWAPAARTSWRLLTQLYSIYLLAGHVGMRPVAARRPVGPVKECLGTAHQCRAHEDPCRHTLCRHRGPRVPVRSGCHVNNWAQTAPGGARPMMSYDAAASLRAVCLAQADVESRAACLCARKSSGGEQDETTQDDRERVRILPVASTYPHFVNYRGRCTRVAMCRAQRSPRRWPHTWHPSPQPHRATTRRRHSCCVQRWSMYPTASRTRSAGCRRAAELRIRWGRPHLLMAKRTLPLRTASFMLRGERARDPGRCD